MLMPVFYGSVNRWECDENDHLNVRFFAQKIQQTLHFGLVESGLANPDNAPSLSRQIKSQHMRYIAEARMAVPITGYFGVVSATADGLEVLCELHNTATETVLASFLIELIGDYDTSHISTISLPEHAGSRGVPAEPFEWANLNIDELIHKGCMKIGAGVIQADECDSDGYLQNYQYMGRHSDSMPNLFTRFETEQRGDGFIGGAVLEYRMNFNALLKAGDRFEIVSGVKALGDKTQTFVHVMFNADSGELVTGSEALAITMDLQARKAIPIPEPRRQRMTTLLLT